MIALTRHRVHAAESTRFLRDARAALDVLRGRPGFLGGDVARAIDDATLWIITTTWADVGSYRRALSAYDVKLSVMPLLSQAVDEPTAFEVLTEPDAHGSALAADAGEVGIGQAAAPEVRTDLD
jgi:hypothetical protein